VRQKSVAHDDTDTAASYPLEPVAASTARGFSACRSANQAEQQAGGEEEQGGERGGQVRNRIHFIDPGVSGNVVRVWRAWTTLAAAGTDYNRVGPHAASKRDFFPLDPKCLIEHAREPPPRRDDAAEGPATRTGSPVTSFSAWNWPRAAW
jgi:hypothetical protein